MSVPDEEKSLLLQLPDDVLEEIFSHLSFDNVAAIRIVCSRFNSICQGILNRGFNSVVQYHMRCAKEVRVQLPRRESKRPHHPLARHNSIYNAIETRITLLKMTYHKYIQSKTACFIPGKIIDELFRIIRLVEATNGNLIPHEVLQELRDISSMAMDHFEEKIVPGLRTAGCLPSCLSPIASSSCMSGQFSSLNESVNATLSSVAQCFGDIPGNSCKTLELPKPWDDDMLDAVRLSVDGASPHVLPPKASPSSPKMVSVSADSLTTLINTLKESKIKKMKLEKQLNNMENKLQDVCRKVQEQERNINEQGRLLSEHSNRFTHQHQRIDHIINSSVSAEVFDLGDSGSAENLSSSDNDDEYQNCSKTQPNVRLRNDQAISRFDASNSILRLSPYSRQLYNHKVLTTTSTPLQSKLFSKCSKKSSGDVLHSNLSKCLKPQRTNLIQKVGGTSSIASADLSGNISDSLEQSQASTSHQLPSTSSAFRSLDVQAPLLKTTDGKLVFIKTNKSGCFKKLSAEDISDSVIKALTSTNSSSKLRTLKRLLSKKKSSLNSKRTSRRISSLRTILKKDFRRRGLLKSFRKPIAASVQCSEPDAKPVGIKNYCEIDVSKAIPGTLAGTQQIDVGDKSC